jgi:hypothetical protein
LQVIASLQILPDRPIHRFQQLGGLLDPTAHRLAAQFHPKLLTEHLLLPKWRNMIFKFVD